MIDEATAASEDRPDEAKDSRSPNVPKENKVPAANRINLKYKDKDLKTISKDLSHTRQLVNTAKQGHGFFKRLQREEQEKKTAQLMEQRKLMEKRKTAWQPPKLSSDEESEEEQDEAMRFFKTEPVMSTHLKGIQRHSHNVSSKRKNVSARPYTPLYCSLVSSRFTDRDVEPLHRQLCALNWLLEAVAAEPPNTMGPVSTCWSARDPGGMKNASRKINKDKSIEVKWEQFISQPKLKKSTMRILQKTPLRFRRTSFSAASPANVSSSMLTPVFDSASSEIASSGDRGTGTPAPVLESVCEIPDDDSTISSIHTQNKQDEEEEEAIPDYLQKLIDSVHESINKELHGEEAHPRHSEESSTAVVSTGKVNPWASYSTEPHTDVNKLQQRPKRKRWDTSRRRFRALDNITSFYTYNEDMQRSLQESGENKTEGNAESWFCSLLPRVPEEIRGNQKISQALRKLEKFGERQSLRIRPQQFLKTLHGLRNWELCSPDISAAIEFMRDKVIQMPAEDYDNWLQLKLNLPKRAQSAPPMR